MKPNELTKEQENLLAGLGMHWEKHIKCYIVRFIPDVKGVCKEYFSIEWIKQNEFCFNKTGCEEAFNTFEEAYERAKKEILQFEQDNFEEIKAHWQDKGWEYVVYSEFTYFIKEQYMVWVMDSKPGSSYYSKAALYKGKPHVLSINERLRRADNYLQAVSLLNL